MRIHALDSFSEAPRGKFVLLRFRGTVHFVSGSVEQRPYHANLIFDFFAQTEWGRAEWEGETRCAIRTPGWEILGGGRYEIDEAEGVLILSEKSTAYGKFSAEEIAAQAADLLAAMPSPGFRLRLD